MLFEFKENLHKRRQHLQKRGPEFFVGSLAQAAKVLDLEIGIWDAVLTKPLVIEVLKNRHCDPRSFQDRWD